MAIFQIMYYNFKVLKLKINHFMNEKTLKLKIAINSPNLGKKFKNFIYVNFVLSYIFNLKKSLISLFPELYRNYFVNFNEIVFYHYYVNFWWFFLTSYKLLGKSKWLHFSQKWHFPPKNLWACNDWSALSNRIILYSRKITKSLRILYQLLTSKFKMLYNGNPLEGHRLKTQINNKCY